MKPTKLPHSVFWLGETMYREMGNTPVHQRRSPEYIMRLSSIKKGIANYVRIVTGREVPVHFSVGKTSFATGEERVYIAATDDPEKIDVMVGLSLHEAAHLLLTKKTENVPDSLPVFDFMHKLNTEGEHFVTPTMRKNAIRLGVSVQSVIKDIKSITNVLEDRRDDQWMYTNMVGYRPYYEAMYDALWHSPVIDTALKSPLTHRPLLKYYLFHVTNMTNVHAHPDYLPGLREMWEIIDLPRVDRFVDDARWDTWEKDARQYKHGVYSYAMDKLPEMLQVILTVVDMIYANAQVPAAVASDNEVMEQQQESRQQKQKREVSEDELDDDQDINFDPDDDDNLEVNEDEDDGDTETENQDRDDQDERDPADDRDGDEEEESGDDDSSSDGGDDHEGGSTEAGKDVKRDFNEAELDEAIAKQEKLLRGEVEKESATSELQRDVDALESSGAELKSVGESFVAKCPCIVYHKLTPQLLRSSVFPYAKTYGLIPSVCKESAEGVKEGEQLGNALAHRLQIMADESTLIYTRQQHGKLDKRLISGLGYGAENVFNHVLVERMDPVLLHLSIDASSSMEGLKWKNAMSVAVALAKAAEKVRSLDVVISLRSGDGGKAAIAVVYDSRVDNFIKIRTMFSALRPNGGTPEGLTFEAIKEHFLDTSRGVRRFFVNISDGQPMFGWSSPMGSHSYVGKTALDHTARQIKYMRDAGIIVLSYFVGNGSLQSNTEHMNAFRVMYGREAEFINVQNITEITRTLNRMFLNN